MSIDLIPTDYRDALRRRRRAVAAGTVTALACAGLLAGALHLHSAAAAMRARSDDIRTALAVDARQREQLAQSDERLKALDEEWTLLQGLRSGAAAEDLFRIIDAALPGDDVWFTEWRFARAGVIAPPSAKTVNSGYFIIVPAGQGTEAQPRWQVLTHMDITGEARNHAALSRFVRGLFAQPQIQDVKVNRTHVRDYVGTRVVDFSLAIVLHSEPPA
jgi:hypothetical protein